MAIATCNQCKGRFERSTSAINRAIRIGSPLYCGKWCYGIARRKEKSPSQKREEKAAYDKARRDRNSEEIRARKREAYYARHAENLAKMKEGRKKRMPAHVEYCRRPEYRMKKSDYDKQHRASEYGEFADTYLLLLEVEREIRSRATHYERRVANGYYTRSAQARRRALCQLSKKNSPQSI